MMGRKQKIPIDLIDKDVIIDLPLTHNEYANNLKQTLQQAYQIIRTNTKIRVDNAKLKHERTIAGCKFEIGDKDWYLNDKKMKRKNKSLEPKFIGPYTITAILENEIDYIMKEENKKNAKPITVHRSKLRKCFTRLVKRTSNTIDKEQVKKKRGRKPKTDTEQTKINNQQENTAKQTLKKARGRPRKKKENNQDTSSNTNANSNLLIMQIA